MANFKSLLCFLSASLFLLSAAASYAAELQLAGIRLGRSATTVLQVYGNPTEVRIGSAPRTQEQQPQAEQFPGAEMMNPELQGMEGLAGMMGMFGMGLPPGQTAQAPTRRGPPEVTWIYRFPRNRTLEFILSPDGRVMQIAAFGVEWPAISTSKGMKLGVSTYKDVIVKYGFPEAHQRSGVELIARYPEKHRAIFTFVGQTLVGITIGLMD